MLGAVRPALWVLVSQYSYRELSVASFEYVHSLSLDFHLGKKTGEVLSALGKGKFYQHFPWAGDLLSSANVVGSQRCYCLLSCQVRCVLRASDCHRAVLVNLLDDADGTVAHWSSTRNSNAYREQDAVK